ncbi:MAG: DUF362 domain-containing protein [Actinobacteria bacterium]|nr:DUF362 domain-containing protein [Actinomycetota bacterium]
MNSIKVKFASAGFERIDPDRTLPAKFKRLLAKTPIKKIVKDKTVALKMHLGANIGYTTIHPIFVKTLVNAIRDAGGDVFITDLFVMDSKNFGVRNSKNRGYTEDILGAPIYPVAGVFDKYYYSKKVSYKTLREIQVAGHINDAEVMINFSHFKGHGVSSYGGAIKNIAMGCVTQKTRHDLHSLHSGGSGIAWNEELCTHCEKCIDECRYKANKFDSENKYETSVHDCTFCLHCVEICPEKALKFEGKKYLDFIAGMSLSAIEVLKTFDPANLYYINVLTNITFLCDCWGMSTPSLVPDIGIFASEDIAAIEKASLDMIKAENILPGSLPSHWELKKEGHLFERVWGKNPYLQMESLVEKGFGNINYEIEEVS